MKNRIGLFAAFATLALASSTEADASQLGAVHAASIRPIITRPPVVFDPVHGSELSFGKLPAQSSSKPINCVWFFGAAFCAAGVVNKTPVPFDAVLNAGVEIESAQTIWADPNTWDIGFIQFAYAPSVAYVHETAFFDMPTRGLVRASANVALQTSWPKAPRGIVVLAVQTQNDAGNWVDAATLETPALEKNTNAVIPMEVDAYVDPATPVRMELRSGGLANMPNFVVSAARFFVQECVPDQNNPGHCL